MQFKKMKNKAAVFFIFVVFLYLLIYFLFNISVKRQLQFDPIHFLKTPKIFCMILTSPDNIESKAKVVYQTWATKCDGFRFISTLPETMQIKRKSFRKDLHFYKSILQPKGLIKDTYETLTDKVYLTFKHLNLKHNEFDWYLKADDDTFIFMDNLRTFLNDKNSSLPVTYGYDFKKVVPFGYHSGGGGYVLSKEALVRIGSKLNEDYSFCPNTGYEDTDVALCLRMLDVYPNKSIDRFGRERFHPLNITDFFYGDFPEWMIEYASNPIQTVH